MAIAVGQHAVTSNAPFGSASSLTTSSLTTAPTGSTFAVCVSIKSQSISSVVDSFGNTYTLKQSGTPGGGFNVASIYICEGGSGGSGHTATVTLSGLTTISVFFDEITGAANPGYDVGNNGAATGAGPSFTGAAVTTTNANDLVLSLMSTNNGGTITDSGSGFSIIDSVPTNGLAACAVSYAVETSTGTYSDTYTTDSSNSAGWATIAIKAASTAAASTISWQPILSLNPPGKSPGKFGRFYQSPKSYALSTASTSVLSGTASLVFGQTGALTATGVLTGTSALLFAQTAALVGAGALSGTSALSFGQSGTLLQPGLSGSAALTFGQTGTLSAAGVLAGSSALQFGQTAALAATGALAGASALTIGQTAALTAVGILAGTSALTFAQTATLAATGVLAGTSAVTFGASATADLPAGALQGTAALSFGGAAILTGFAALIGACQIVIGCSGSLIQPDSGKAGPVDDVRSADGFFRRKKKLRKVEKPAEPVFISPASFEREIPPALIVKAKSFQSLADLTGKPVQVLRAQIDHEIESLMRAHAERDDEEAIEWILKALD